MKTERLKHSARRLQGAFTLLELLVTLAVLGLVVSLSLPLLSSASTSAGLTADARRLAAALRSAREMALATRTSVTVGLDLAEPGFVTPGHGEPEHLRFTDRLLVHTANGSTEWPTLVMFFPGGGSTGADISLTAASGSRLVSVNWLTGVVRCCEAD